MSKKSTKALASATIMSLVMTTSLAVPASAAVNQNLAGVGRYETAAKIVDAGWTTATTAIIASGEDANRVDALTVAPLAKKLDAPVVLAKPGKAIDADTLAKLAKLGVKTVYIANGTGVFTTDVDAQLAKAGMTVKRLGGNSRFQTALNIAKEFGPAKSIVVASANDANLVDSLSIASIAAIKGMPIFISENDTLNADEAAYIKTLGVEKSYVVGGLVKDATLTAAGINGATRLAGAGRYESNYAVLNAFKDDADIKTATNVYVASGENANLIDALAGAPLAAKKGAPIVLAHDSILADTQTLLKGKVNKDTDVEIFGGTGAVTTNVATAFTSLLNGDTTTTDLKAGDITAVKAISNTKVEVTFKDGVTPTTDAAAYKVVTKGTTTALAVSNAALEGSKVVLTTAAQTAGTAYTLTAGAANFNFAGIAAVKLAPTVTSVKGTDTNTVEVTFDSRVDTETALAAANYTLNNSATVKSASLDATRKIVTLTTDGVSKGKLYTVKIANVKNSDGVAIAATTKTFAGAADTLAPALNGTVRVFTNNRIRISFTDDHGIDKASAENMANYAITDASGNALKISSITANLDDNNEFYNSVDIVTDSQNLSTKYTVTISNLADGSVSANKLVKPLTTTFYGRAISKNGPTVDATSIQPIGNNIIKLTFNTTSALDIASATNPANYVINKDVQVLKAEITDDYDPYLDNKVTVKLTTSAMEKGGYSLTVSGVNDEFGYSVKPLSGTTYRSYSFTCLGQDVIPPFVSSVTSTDESTIKITFDNFVDKATANDPTNYTIDNSVGSVLLAKLGTDGKTVTLTTPKLTANTIYTVTMNGIQDLCGNTLSNVKAKVVAMRSTSDVIAPTALYAQALNKDEFRVYFDKAVNVAGVNTASGTSTITLDHSITATPVDTADDDATVIYKVTSGTKLTDSTKYTISAVSGITNKSNINYTVPAAGIELYGTSLRNEGPSYLSYEQINTRLIKVHFSDTISSTMLAAAPTGLTFARDNDDYTVLDITSTAKFDTTKDLTIDFSKYVTDEIYGNDGTDGVALDNGDSLDVISNATTIRPYDDDDLAPSITNVEALNINTIKVTFSAPVQTTGGYRVSYLDSNGNKAYVTLGTITQSTDKTYITIAVTSPTLASSTASTFKLEPTVGALGYSDKVLDVKNNIVDFGCTDVKGNATYISGIEITTSSSIVIHNSNSTVLDPTAAYQIQEENAGVDGSGNAVSGQDLVGSKTQDADGKSMDMSLTQPLLAGKTYDLMLNGTKLYSFNGVVDSANIAVTNTVVGATTTSAITFSDANITSPSAGVYTSDRTVSIYKIASNGTITLGTPDYTSTSADVTATGFKHDNIGINAGDKILVIVKDAVSQILYAIKTVVQ